MQPPLRRGPRFLALHAGLALGLAVSCGPDAPPPSVLLITIDTLRADHLGAYGSELARTPNIDRLASESTLFETAAAPMPLTRPSHFSILTSRYPREHGVVNNEMSLPEEEDTLPEMLGRRGYRTAAYLGVRLLGGDSGANQGFEVFDAPTNVKQRAAETVVTGALEWLGGLHPEERFFLWLHVFDPHLPYAPPAELRDLVQSEVLEEYPSVDWAELKEIAAANDGDVPARYLEHAKALYRGDIAYTDIWIGKLLDELRASGRLNDTLTILTADHGESFENGVFFEHADSLSDGALRVPLIVRYPKVFGANVREANQTSTVDIAPTILELVGMDAPRRFSGRSLLEAARTPDRYVLVQHPIYQPGAAQRRPAKQRHFRSVAGEPTAEILVDEQRVGIQGGGWKLVRTGDAYALFEPNGGEEVDVADARREVAEEMARALDAMLKQHPLRVIEPTQLNPQALQDLIDLGYAGEE